MLIKKFLPIKDLKFLQNCLLLKLKNNSIISFYLSAPFFLSNENNNINLSFFNKFDYSKFISDLNTVLKNNLIIFFIKFKLKGLGYRFRKISKYLYRFYFTRTSYIYFHKPDDIIVKSRKKRVIMLSFNKQILNEVFNNILYLHKIGPYNRRGFTYHGNILIKKPGKKVV